MTPSRMRQLFLGLGLALLAGGLALHFFGPLPAAHAAGGIGGIGAGFLLAGLLQRLLPRWWREQCDEDAALPANRAYQREMWPALIAYVVAVLGSTLLIRQGIEARWLRGLLALLPVIPVLFVLRAMLRYLRAVDELQQRIEAEAVCIAAVGVATLYFAGGFLVLAKVVAVPAGVAMIWVFPLLMLGYGLAKVAVARRYR